MIADEGSQAKMSYIDVDSICYVKCSKELFNSYPKHSNEPVQCYKHLSSLVFLGNVGPSVDRTYDS